MAYASDNVWAIPEILDQKVNYGTPLWRRLTAAARNRLLGFGNPDRARINRYQGSRRYQQFLRGRDAPWHTSALGVSEGTTRLRNLAVRSAIVGIGVGLAHVLKSSSRAGTIVQTGDSLPSNKIVLSKTSSSNILHRLKHSFRRQVERATRKPMSAIHYGHDLPSNVPPKVGTIHPYKYRNQYKLPGSLTSAVWTGGRWLEVGKAAVRERPSHKFGRRMGYGRRRGYGRKRRRYGRGRRPATRKYYNKRAGKKRGEKKYFPFSLGTAASRQEIISTSVVTALSGNITEGTGYEQRVGRKVFLKYLYFRGIFKVKGTSRQDLIRFDVVCTKTPTAPTQALIYDDTGADTFNSFRNLNFTNEYSVIRSFKLHLKSTADAADNGEIAVDWRIPLMKTASWNIDGTTAQFGHVYLLVTGSKTTGSTAAEVYGSGRITFTDV